MIRFALFSIVMSLACLGVQGQRNPDKPNVLFIFIDDLRPDLGAYGNTVVKTPNLDRLAKEAMLFHNHYVQVPTCGASRFSLLTGMLPKKKAHLRNDAIERFISQGPRDDKPETFIHHLRNNGYHTVGIGKISHSADGFVYPYRGEPDGAPRELPQSWTELLFDYGQWQTGWNAFFGYADGTNRQMLDGQVRPYEAGGGGDSAYVDGLTAGLAVAKLAALGDADRPFFLGVGFFKPHLPFTAPKKYWDLYDEDSLPLSPFPKLPENVSTASFHQSGEFNSYRSGEEHPSLGNQVSDAYARKIVHAYYAAISYTDAQVGRVLQALRENNLESNTIVVIWSDHGWQLGDYRVWGKHTLTEKALRSPLLVKVPGKRAGSTRRITSTVDIYASLMDFCSLPMPYASDGESFAQVFDRQEHRGRVAYGYFNNGITVRTERFRLTRYDRKEEPVVELYDHRRDPHETRNVASRRPQAVKRLMEILERGDTGLYAGEVKTE